MQSLCERPEKADLSSILFLHTHPYDFICCRFILVALRSKYTALLIAESVSKFQYQKGYFLMVLSYRHEREMRGGVGKNWLQACSETIAQK